MGCVSSKGDINDRHPNIFHVTNVNDQGRSISPGKLEVTESELVLHQRGKNPTRWPLKSLRKYGFDIEVFSFECGRRCPTGHGIYAFRCRKAEQLFNMVQQHITGTVNEDNIIGLHNNTNTTNFEFPVPAVSTGPPVQRRFAMGFQPDGYLNPVQPLSRSHTIPSRPSSVSSNGQISPTTTSPPPVINEVPLEHNNNKRNSLIPTSTVVENGTGPPTYANLGILPQENVADSTCHVYMNVDTNKEGLSNTKECSELETEDIHCYANIDAKDIENLRPLTGDTQLNSIPPTPTAPYEMDYITVREVNYAELDLDSGKKNIINSPIALESPNVEKKSYATIDFPKTIALSQSINPKMDLEEGSRKTRHNSTINSFSD